MENPHIKELRNLISYAEEQYNKFGSIQSVWFIERITEEIKKMDKSCKNETNR